MTVVILLGLGAGLGALGIVRALRPAPQHAAAVLAALDGAVAARAQARGRTDAGGARDGRFRPDRLLGMRMARAVDDGRLPSWTEPGRQALGQWLSVCDTTMVELCSQVVLGAGAGLVIPALFVAVATVARTAIPAVVPIAFGAVVSAVCAAVPVLSLRSEARDAQRAARTVVASYLDLVVLGLAGGMGVEGALHAAAGVADDPFSRRIGEALGRARHAGAPPWRALASLGSEVGVPELTELSAAVGLAGTEGARIRQTLASKSASIRRHQLADAETEANTLTERLFVPGAFLLVGFLLFVGYPAVARIVGGF
jgi:hypothetical protein